MTKKIYKKKNESQKRALYEIKVARGYGTRSQRIETQNERQRKKKMEVSEIIINKRKYL